MVVESKEVIYRECQPGEELAVLKLFQEVFHKEMSYAFWKWRYRDNPFGEAISRVALAGDRIIGHFAILPMEVQFDGGLYRAIFPVTAMTHPDYAGRGVFTRLITETYELCRRQGFTLAYGFFNMNSYYVTVRRVGYAEKNVRRMSTLEKKAPFPQVRSDTAIKKIEAFGSWADQFWGRVKRNYRAVTPRTEKFLNWRYAQYKEVDYSTYVLLTENEVLGYIVLKVYVAGSAIRGHIVDLLSIPDEKVVKSLVLKAYEFFTEKQVPEVSCWMPTPFYRRVLEKEGFKRREAATNFGVLLLDKSRKDLLALENPNIWHLTMGDSDVF